MGFNSYQQTLLRTYDSGSFSHLTHKDEVKTCGDSLFAFLFSELATEEDCDNKDTAVTRIETVCFQVETLWEALTAIN